MRRHASAVLHLKSTTIEHRITLVTVISGILGNVLQTLTAFHVFLSMRHALAHHIDAAALHGYITRKSGMAAKLKGGTVLHGHIHGGIGIVPVVGIGVAVGVDSIGRTRGVNGICAAKHHLAIIHLQAAVVVLQVGMHAVEHPGTATGILNLQRRVLSILERTEEGHVATLAVYQR